MSTATPATPIGLSVEEFGRDARYLRPDARRPLRRRRARRGWRRIAVAGLRSLAAVALVLGTREGIRQLVTSRAFETKEIVVEGSSRANPDEIRQLVKGAEGRNIFDLDLAELRREAESHPWVRTADVRRRLPGTISLTVTERIPAGVALIDGRFMLVDEEGSLLAECGTTPEPCDHPVMRGLDGIAPPERAARLAAGVAAMKAVFQLAPDVSRKISEVDLSHPDRIEVLPGDGAAPIYLSTEDYGRNLANYRSIEPQIGERFPKLEYVDLRFRGRIAVMPAEIPPAPHASGRRSAPAAERSSAGEDPDAARDQ